MKLKSPPLFVKLLTCANQVRRTRKVVEENSSNHICLESNETFSMNISQIILYKCVRASAEIYSRYYEIINKHNNNYDHQTHKDLMKLFYLILGK